MSKETVLFEMLKRKPSTRGIPRLSNLEVGQKLEPTNDKPGIVGGYEEPSLRP